MRIVGARVQVCKDLQVVVGSRPKQKSWAAGLYGEVVELRPDAVRIVFEHCSWCKARRHRVCKGNHWIKNVDLAIRNGLDTVLDLLPLAFGNDLK